MRGFVVFAFALVISNYATAQESKPEWVKDIEALNATLTFDQAGRPTSLPACDSPVALKILKDSLGDFPDALGGGRVLSLNDLRPSWDEAMNEPACHIIVDATKGAFPITYHLHFDRFVHEVVMVYHTG